MSTLIGLKLDDTVVLATDSRIMDNTGKHILTDSAQKVFEIAPGTFYGWSGYGSLATPQVQIAVELARTADMQKLRAFAEQLDTASQGLMRQLLDTLAGIQNLRAAYAAELAGQKPFHAYVLAGVSDGCPGFLAREFWLIEGQITVRETYAFNLPAGHNFSMYVTYGEFLADLVQSPKTWAQGAAQAVDTFVEHLRTVQPLVGGPTQMAVLNKDGHQWIHRPSVMPFMSEQVGPATLPVGVFYGGTVNASQINAGTISAAVTMTSPTLVITSGSTTVNVDGSNFVMVSNSATARRAQMTYALHRVEDSTNTLRYAQVMGFQFQAQNSQNGGATYETCVLSPYKLEVDGLPTAYPGAGSKQLWADPGDSYRVKYAA